MNLQAMINDVADQADDLLADCANAEEARPQIMAYLRKSHPGISAADAKAAIAGVLRILGNEGFFEGARGGGGYASDDGSEGAPEE
jgi:hypothetical protein